MNPHQPNQQPLNQDKKNNQTSPSPDTEKKDRSEDIEEDDERTTLNESDVQEGPKGNSDEQQRKKTA